MTLRNLPALFCLIFLSVLARPIAAETPTADELVSRVNAVDEGAFVTRTLKMQLTDRRGKQRDREAVDKRMVMVYSAPANVRDTGFLIWDYADPEKEDDQWLYLPALRKVRRISASQRGDYFLGTDFTYEDMKLDGKLEPRDYNFSLVGREEFEGKTMYLLKGVPKSKKIAKELGYSRFTALIDPDNWIIRRTEFWDLKERPLKTLLASDIRQVDGIWTRHHLDLTNHNTGHSTVFVFSDVDYATPVDDARFNKRSLERGL